MKELIILELKKINNRNSLLCVTIMIIVSLIMNYIALTSSDAYTSQGNEVNGVMASKSILNNLGNIRGTLNQEYMDNLILEYDSSIEKQDKQSYIGHYLTRFTFSNCIINFAQHGINTTNLHMDLPPSLNEEEFYKNYKKSIVNTIKQENKNNWFEYSDRHIQVLENKIEKINTPFEIDYLQGLAILVWQFKEQLILVFLITTFILSAMFSKDSDIGISQIGLSTKYGRKYNFIAKIIASNILGVLIYIIFIITLISPIGIFASFTGYNQSIQNLWNTCIYNINIGQGILLMIILGLLQNMLITNLCLLVSIYIPFYKISCLFGVFNILFLHCDIFTNNKVIGQLNPISMLTSMYLPRFFTTFYFIDDMLIPYFAVAIFLIFIYLCITLVLIHIKINRYKI